MATPESKTKKRIKEILAKYGSGVKTFWPVQNGMGAATIDAHVCGWGQYLVIEAKALGEVATPRQGCTLREYDEAGAENLVIDGSDYQPLIDAMDRMRKRAGVSFTISFE